MFCALFSKSAKNDIYNTFMDKLDNGAILEKKTYDTYLLNGKAIKASWDCKRCEICLLELPSSLRYKGNGSSMLRYMEQQLREAKCKEVKVYVGPLNAYEPVASEFYRKNGYVHRSPGLITRLRELLGWSCSPQAGVMIKQLS